MTLPTPTGYSNPMSSSTGYKTRQFANFTPEQMQLFNQLLGKSSGAMAGGGLSQGLDYLSRLAGGQAMGFQQEEAPAYEAYNKALAQQANRYAGLGALDSSSFQNMAAGGASELAMNLAARRGELQRRAIENLLGFSERMLGAQPYSYLQEQQTKPDWLGLLGGLGGSLLGSAFGPIGTTAGSAIGSKLSGLLG